MFLCWQKEGCGGEIGEQWGFEVLVMPLGRDFHLQVISQGARCLRLHHVLVISVHQFFPL